MHEANVSQDHVLINAPEGFLFEWWAVFWDIYNARNNKPSSSDARTYVEVFKLPLLNLHFNCLISVSKV